MIIWGYKMVVGFRRHRLIKRLSFASSMAKLFAIQKILTLLVTLFLGVSLRLWAVSPTDFPVD